MATTGSRLPGQQSPTSQDVMRSNYFVSDNKWDDIKQDKHKYDLVVIGSGFCGLAAVTRALKKNPRTRILMIERGDFFLPCHFKSLGAVYAHVRRGLAETYPWSVSPHTDAGKLGIVTKQHGMVPFFGGKSTVWNAWCPRPSEEEMADWPRETVDRVKNYLDDAELLLNVRSVGCVGCDNSNNHCKTRKRRHDGTSSSSHQLQSKTLQTKIGELLSGVEESVECLDRVESARIAMASKNGALDKFSVPSALLGLVMTQRRMHDDGTGEEIDIVCSCVVERIIHDGGRAIALQTSRGDLKLHNAKLVIAAGTLPATTLVRNSFPEIVKRWTSERFAAQIVTSITARIPVYDDLKESPLECSAHYIPGWTKSRMQFHVQLSGYIDQRSEEDKVNTTCHMPVSFTKAEHDEGLISEDHILLKCCALGQLNHKNEGSWFKENADDSDITTNSVLQIQSNSVTDLETWDTMEQAMFKILDLLPSDMNQKIEYLTKKTPGAKQWKWTEERPNELERRKTVAMHESSTMYIGEEDDAPVDLDYKLRGTTNVYITGGALWPTAGAWNPVLTMVAMTMDMIERVA